MAPPAAPTLRPQTAPEPRGRADAEPTCAGGVVGVRRLAAALSAAALGVLATAAQAQTPRFELIPSDSPTTHYTRPTGVTRDGSVVSGAELAYEPFINPKRPTWFWSPDRGKYNLPGSPTYLDETRIAGDGFHLVNRFGRLTLATNQWSFFDPVPGNDTIGSTFISHDGRVVAGTSEDLGGDDARAFVWTDQTGTVELPAYNGKSAWSQYAYGISGDGATVVGAMNHPDFVNSVGYAWNRDSGYTIFQGTFLQVANRDGSVLGGSRPSRVENGVLELLGRPSDFGFADCESISDDGSIIVGSLTGGPSFAPDFVGFVWTRESGTVLADDYLGHYGLQPPHGTTISQLIVSGDGRTFAGLLVNLGDGQPYGGFVAVIPAPGVSAFALACVGFAIRRRR